MTKKSDFSVGYDVMIQQGELIVSALETRRVACARRFLATLAHCRVARAWQKTFNGSAFGSSHFNRTHPGYLVVVWLLAGATRYHTHQLCATVNPRYSEADGVDCFCGVLLYVMHRHGWSMRPDTRSKRI